MSVIDQLAGVRIPASALEPLVLAPRVRDYSPAMLDELLATGEVTWSGAGSISGSDGWIALHLADSAALTLAGPAEIDLTRRCTGRSWTRWPAAARTSSASSHRTAIDEAALKTALWELIWAGWITGDTFAPVRAMLGGSGARKRSAPAHRAHRPPRLSRYSFRELQRMPSPAPTRRWPAGGRPCLLAEPDSTLRAHYQAELLLNRHGVLTKGAVAAEGVPGGFATLYKVLSTFEEAGRLPARLLRRVAGRRPVRRRLHRRPAAQLPRRCRPGTAGIPRGRAGRRRPGQPLRRGAALARSRTTEATARPGRKAGALVVLVDGELAWFLERGGRSLLTFTDDPAADHAAAVALADLVAARRVASILVERIDGVPALRPQSGPGRVAEAPGGAFQTPASPARRAACGCGELGVSHARG